MRINGTKARQDGLSLVFLGASVILMLMTFLLFAPTSNAFKDFKPSYFSARCLIEHCDPYKESDVERVYRLEGEARPDESELNREIVTRYVYPPTSFVVASPFALLPWGSARMLWMIVSSGSLILAALLVWDLGADYAPILSGAFVGFLVANCLVLTVLSNPSGIVIGLCAIAVWCFMRNRFVYAGILCLALSLAFKPQGPGLVWLYFLLAGGIYRKRAVNTLLAAVGVSLPVLAWVWRVAPGWIQELHSNILSFSGHGGMFDPGPTTKIPHTFVDLQVFISAFKDDPRFYNPLAYLICAILLLVWIVVTLRFRFTPKGGWLALAAVVPLSMLPLHHHLYDTKLLMLAVPAAAILWVEGGWMKWVSLCVNATAFLLTGDITQTIYTRLMERLLPPAHGAMEEGVRAFLVFPIPIILLIMAIFYLWVYTRYTFSRDSLDPESADPSTIRMVQTKTLVQG